MYIGIFLHHKCNIPDGELAASLRYLSQKFTMVTPEAKATLNDIATEEFAHVEMMGLIGMGNNPMVGATVAVAVAVEEAMK